MGWIWFRNIALTFLNPFAKKKKTIFQIISERLCMKSFHQEVTLHIKHFLNEKKVILSKKVHIFVKSCTTAMKNSKMTLCSKNIGQLNIRVIWATISIIPRLLWYHNPFIVKSPASLDKSCNHSQTLPRIFLFFSTLALKIDPQ